VDLLLAAADVTGPGRWRWELRDAATGQVIAEHRVSLDDAADSDQVTALGDLYEYVRWHADPLWRDDEPRIVRETGTWASHAVLGDAITAAITAAAPATVLVSAPAPADQALLWPLELAFADGAPLAARGDVSFVYRMGNSTAAPGNTGPANPASANPGRPVRMLAAFSSPAGTGAIGLRRERYELAALIRRIADRDGAEIELRLLQYGVTRERLSEVVGSGGGWDLVHLSGHGSRAGFALERPDGSLDYVGTADLADLLRPTLGRLKLAVLSSCRSAAEAKTDTLRLLGLPENEPEAVAGHIRGLARGLTEELGCAVIATRYPVTVEFSTAFNQVFYERLLSSRDPAGLAVGRALAAVLAEAPATPPGLPAATVGVFGASAAGLVLAAPADPRPGGAETDTATARLAGFAGQPERFVGREAIMTAASAALLAGSGTTTVLLHGMPGIGKTACALELAYLCQDQFGAAAFWRPPASGDPDLVLESLADALYRQLGPPGAGFAPPPRWRRRWDTYAQRLRESMRTARVLVVLDNLEELLHQDGRCRDPRWDAVLDALAAHGGESRLVAASRSVPKAFAQAGTFLPLPVGTLPWEESVVLARQLPALRALIYRGQPPALSPNFWYAGGWMRVGEVLDRLDGHPGLLELDAADPAGDAASERAESAIAEWAAATLTALPPDARLMACFVAGLEPRDRRGPVIDETWPGLRRRLGKPGPPGPWPLLDALSAAMLTGPADDQNPLMHPVIAAAIRRETPADVREAADSELAAYWRTLAALPYLTHRQDWDGAAAVLDDALRRGDLPKGDEDGRLPELRRIAAATASPAAATALALAMLPADQAEAVRLLEDSLGSAVAQGDYSLAWLIAGHLADALRDAGHLDQALDVTARQERYAQAAGLGPWSRLAGQGRRLTVLARMGRNEQLLTEFAGARDRMRPLADDNTSGELPCIVPWAVREGILDSGRACLLAFGKWREALDTGAEIQDSERRRGASRHELAITRFFDSYPLIRLHRLTEAARLLVDCQEVFEEEADTGNLSHVFTGRADLEAELNQPEEAARFARGALRLTYTRTIPDPIAAAHQRLFIYLRNTGGPRAEQEAHWLAAALLGRLAGMSRALDDLMLSVPQGLRHDKESPDRSPWTLAGVIEAAEQTPGVHLGELISAVEPDAETVASTLTALLDSAARSGPAVARARTVGQRLFANMGGYELAADPGVASLVNRFRRWLAPPAGGQEREP